MRFDEQVRAVQQLLGPRAVVLEQRTGWVIAIVKNFETGPPYETEDVGTGETFEAAFIQATRAAARMKQP